MGWQQRDWAKLDDDELDQLYGVRRSPAPRRPAFWAIVVSLLLAVLGAGWSLRERAPAAVGPGVTPSALYGFVIPDGSPLGPAGVCQELELADGAWRCDVVTINTAHVPVIRAQSYDGPCAHLKVVDARWACLDTTPVSGVNS